MTEQPTPRRRRAEVDEAILAAIRAEVADGGYFGVTFEGVARRAGTSKTVIYRRYASRAAMVLDSIIPDSFTVAEPPHKGNLRDDLVALGVQMAERLNAVGVDVVRGIMAEVDEQTVSIMVDKSSTFVRHRLAAAIDEARDRGELGPREVHPRVAGTFIAMVRHEMFFTGSDLSRDTVAEIVDLVYLPLLRESTRTP